MSRAVAHPPSPVVDQVEAVRDAVGAAVAAAVVARRRGRPKGSVNRPKSDLAALGAEARAIGTVVLQVLAGERTTSDAARAIGVSPMRYYAIEDRAVHALVAACEPQRPGQSPPVPGERDVERLRADKARLEQEAARLRALLRSTQRSIGLTPAPDPKAKTTTAGGKTRKVRKPRVRALTVVRRLMQAASTTPPAGATPAPAPNGG